MPKKQSYHTYGWGDKSYITTPIPGESIQSDAFPRFSQCHDLSVCYFVELKRLGFPPFSCWFFFSFGRDLARLLPLFFRRWKLNLGAVLSAISLETFLSSDRGRSAFRVWSVLFVCWKSVGCMYSIYFFVSCAIFATTCNLRGGEFVWIYFASDDIKRFYFFVLSNFRYKKKVQLWYVFWFLNIYRVIYDVLKFFSR